MIVVSIATGIAPSELLAMDSHMWQATLQVLKRRAQQQEEERRR